MARLMSIKCARCGNTVEFYEGQGMFKCGNCGALYESLGEGTGAVKMVHAPEQPQPSPGEAMGLQPGMPGSGPQQPGWQQGYYGAQQQAYPYGPQAGFPQYGVYGRRPGYGGGKAMDFLKFRIFITPIFVQVLFWVEIVLFLIAGIGIMIMDLAGFQVLIGLIIILLGPIFARIWCERLVVHFRTYEELSSINAKVGQEEKVESHGQVEEEESDVSG